MERSFHIKMDREKDIKEVLVNWAGEKELDKGPAGINVEEVTSWAGNMLKKGGNRAIYQSKGWISLFWAGRVTKSQVNFFLSKKGMSVRVLTGKTSESPKTEWVEWAETCEREI